MNSKKDSQKKRKRKPANWRVVEKVVAEAFKAQNVQVQRNVRLDALRRKGGKGGRREFDVLITGRLAGQTVHFPIECKNYNTKRVGSQDIDAFIGKLQDVGLPTQTSIFVSTSGFSSPAVSRADEVGMKTLVLKEDGSSERSNPILAAIQSHIFMICSVTGIKCKTVEPQFELLQHFFFYDEDGAFAGTLPDFLWQSWLQGTLPAVCGQHKVEIMIPETWKHKADGSANSVHDIEVTYEVTALLFQFSGEARNYRFDNVLTGETERRYLQVDFPTDPHKTPPIMFSSEEELNNALTNSAQVCLTFDRIPMPKIVFNKGMLYPFSPRIQQHADGKDTEYTEADYERMAQSPMNTFWDFGDSHAETLMAFTARSGVRFNTRRD